MQPNKKAYHLSPPALPALPYGVSEINNFITYASTGQTYPAPYNPIDNNFNIDLQVSISI